MPLANRRHSPYLPDVAVERCVPVAHSPNSLPDHPLFLRLYSDEVYLIEPILVPSRTRHQSRRAPTTGLVAFVGEYRRCGKLDSGFDDRWIWMSCECGESIMQRVEGPHHDRQNSDLTGR